MALSLRETRFSQSSRRLRYASGVWAETRDELDLLVGNWPDAARLPSSQPGWLRACLHAFDTETCHVVARKSGSAVAAVAPLVGKRVLGMWRLVAPGGDELHEPVDLMWSDERALRLLAASLARCSYPVHIPRVPADSPIVRALRRGAWGRAWCSLRPARPHPFVVLDESWVEPERHLLATDRRRLERARRTAERRGPLTTEIHTPDLGELPELLDAALEIDRLTDGDEADAALALDRAVFYRQYAEAACIDGALRICLLRVGGRLAAMHLAVESEGSLWLLRAATHPDFSACWPSQLLARETIRYAAQANLETLELWGPSQPWMRSWTTAERPCVSIRLYPLRLQCLAASAIDVSAGAIDRWRRWRKAR